VGVSRGVKIKNYGGRAWISKLDTEMYANQLTYHIANAEVESVELKGSQLVIHIKKS